MILLGWLNILALGALAARFALRRGFPRGEQPLIWFVMIWLALILTGHALTLIGELNNPLFYFAVSLAMMAAALKFFDKIAPANAAPQPLLPFASLPFVNLSPRAERWLERGLLALLLLAAACSLTLALNNYAGNADSVSYRLPRTFWYVSHGGFMHPFEAFDRRTVFYPLNGVAIYAPLVTYGAPGTFHNLPTYIAWLAVVLICYRFAGALGARRWVALLATALAALTPDILVQAAATNDEILAASILLFALFALFRWLQSDQPLYLMLAVTAVGIGIGTKLHIVFYMPVMAAALVMAVIGFRRAPGALREVWRRTGWARLGQTAFILAAMILPFLIYNKLSAGKFYFADEFAGNFFNVKAKLQVFLQNMLIYASQMTLAPIADLYGVSDGQDRVTFHNWLNGHVGPLIEPHLSTDSEDYHLHYRFTGVTLLVSPAFLEYSLWAGFAWLLPPFIWHGIARTPELKLRGWWMLLALSPLVWMITWCASTLYMEGTPTYLAYYLIIAAPALAFALLKIARPWLNRLRWVVIGLVMLTHTIIDTNVYLYNEFRNIPRLFSTGRVPYDWEMMSPSIIDEIKQADKMRISYTRWGLTYFGFMHHNPHAFFYGPHEENIDVENTLQIFSAPTSSRWGYAAIEVPHKPTPGLTYIGKMRGWGTEVILAAGNHVDRRWPDRNRYLLFYAKLKAEDGKSTLMVSDVLPGVTMSDRLEFRYRWKRGGKLLLERDWNRHHAWDAEAEGAGGDALEVAIRLPGQTEPDAQYVMQLSSLREWAQDFPGALSP